VKGIRAGWQKPLIWGVAFLVVAAIAGLAVWVLKPVPPVTRPVTRFTLLLAAGQQLAAGSTANDSSAIALSPDGTRLAYVASQAGTQQLYLRAMDSMEATPIPGTDGAVAPFFSPDSQWLGFFADNKLKKVSVSGGAPITVCDAPLPWHSASWGNDDAIVFSQFAAIGYVSVLFQVAAAGGAPKQVTTPDSKKGEFTHLFPDLLPGGKAMLFAAGPTAGNLANTAQIVVSSLQTGERRDLIGGTSPKYALTGHLVYAQGATLRAVPFDPQRLAVTGSPVPVLEGVLQSPTGGTTQYSFSSLGTLVYVPGGLQGAQRRLVWVDRKGVEQPLPAPVRGYRTPRISPDGRRVAVTSSEAGDNIWLYDLARETLTRLTFEGRTDANPIWTPDGRRIAFASSRTAGRNVFWQPADGSGGVEQLTEFSDYQHTLGSWSPDGVLAFEELNPATGRDIWVLRLSDRKAQPFLHMPFDEAAPAFSPDGRWLAYASDETGRYEIYVQPYPGPGGKSQISTEGGTEPVWAHDGEIFYRQENKIMAVGTKTQPTFSAGNPKVLFEGRYVRTQQTQPNYDVSRDGQRFLMVKASEQTEAATQINVVLNWFEELKRRVPTAKK
jgi:serine/threonine-protein kinase